MRACEPEAIPKSACRKLYCRSLNETPSVERRAPGDRWSAWGCSFDFTPVSGSSSPHRHRADESMRPGAGVRRAGDTARAPSAPRHAAAGGGLILDRNLDTQSNEAPLANVLGRGRKRFPTAICFSITGSTSPRSKAPRIGCARRMRRSAFIAVSKEAEPRLCALKTLIQNAIQHRCFGFRCIAVHSLPLSHVRRERSSRLAPTASADDAARAMQP